MLHSYTAQTYHDIATSLIAKYLYWYAFVYEHWMFINGLMILLISWKHLD